MRETKWYSGLYAAMIAGFEAFGSAQIGMAPSSLRTGNSDAEIEERTVRRTASLATCNQPVAKIEKEFVFDGCTRLGTTEVQVIGGMRDRVLLCFLRAQRR